MNATAEGADMSDAVFEATLELAEHIDPLLTVGGGEPTLHPNFLSYLMEIIEKDNIELIYVITNGTNKKLSLLLYALGTDECLRIGSELSLDDYHDTSMVDPRVKDLFSKAGRVRNVSKHNNISRAGRAADWGYDDRCICEDLFIKPNGDVHLCGCSDSPKIANVLVDDAEDIDIKVEKLKGLSEYDELSCIKDTDREEVDKIVKECKV